MTPRAALGADELRAVMGGFRDGLRLHQADINRLNVYPVPDGDTGTNMALTLEAVVTELEGVEAGAALPDVCRAIGHGSLMGARGNSGVILSQLLRGMSERMGAAGEAGVGPGVLTAALAPASALARRAVVRPVEGTILTVAAAAAEGAAAADGGPSGATLVGVIESAHRVAADALWTPEMLPVLAQAGVVDAGGAGFLLLLDALWLIVDDRPLPEPSTEPPVVSREALETRPATITAAVPRSCRPPAAAGKRRATLGGHHVSDLRYEVMYLLNAPDESIDAFKEVWAGIGHFHRGGRRRRVVELPHPHRRHRRGHRGRRRRRAPPAHPGDRSGRAGRGGAMGPRERGGPPGPGPGPSTGTGPPPTTSVVAVVTSGDGIGRIFRSLGVHHQVVGGQDSDERPPRLIWSRRVESVGLRRGGDPAQ